MKKLFENFKKVCELSTIFLRHKHNFSLKNLVLMRSHMKYFYGKGAEKCLVEKNVYQFFRPILF